MVGQPSIHGFYDVFIELKDMGTSSGGTDMISEVAINKGMPLFVSILYGHALAKLMLIPFTYISDRSSLSQTFYSAGLGCASATFACALSNIVPALMAILFRQERARIISLAVKAKIVGAVIYMIVNGYKSVSVIAVHFVLVLRSARPPQDLKLQQKRPIPFGVRVRNFRRQIAFVMIVLMMSIAVTPMAAASTVNNTEAAYSADEGVGVGDKLPPNCHPVPRCTDDCFPCYESGRHSFCCES